MEATRQGSRRTALENRGGGPWEDVPDTRSVGSFHVAVAESMVCKLENNLER